MESGIRWKETEAHVRDDDQLYTQPVPSDHQAVVARDWCRRRIKEPRHFCHVQQRLKQCGHSPEFYTDVQM